MMEAQQRSLAAGEEGERLRAEVMLREKTLEELQAMNNANMEGMMGGERPPQPPQPPPLSVFTPLGYREPL